MVGKVVELWGADPEGCQPWLAGASAIRPLGPARPDDAAADLLLCLDVESGEQFLRVPLTLLRLQAGIIVAAWSQKAQLSAAPSSAYAARYSYRPVSGAILSDARFSRGRVVALQDGSAGWGADLHLLLWSNTPLPSLPLGLFESQEPVQINPPPPRAANRDAVQDTRAIALTNRLLAVEDRTLALRGETMRLKAQLANEVHGGSSYFDVPKSRHPWPLAETPGRPPASLGLYDRRPDDLVIQAAQQGIAFMAAHGLLSGAPDFAGAVAALNALAKTIMIETEHPVVSIIIPVYGQLPYTLNCLDSLFRHFSRHSVEVIVLDDCSPDGVTEEYVPLIAGVRYHRQPKNGGFIRSCNTGGEIARGDYILLLNSDTRVVKHWLDNIIDSFALFPQAGLVGSKMLYPDGVLQEAGGIIWRNGSAWNYGREDDPNRPQYCYARQVDYISGCSIALTTTLWRSLGGFDPHYIPAYAEDADLCQRVKARGLEVWYQPLSRVVHYEGKTSGTSTTGGVKSYQVTNLKKFFLRWRSRFETYGRDGEGPFFEKERDIAKRVLFADALNPTPNQDAGSVQIVLSMRCSQACGYKSHFVPEDNWLFDPIYTTALQREGVECSYAPFDIGFEDYIRRYGWLYDVIVVYRISVMYKCLPLIRQFAPNSVLLFNLSDLHYLRMQRQAEMSGDIAALEAAERLKERELDTIGRSDCTITHSTVEADLLAKELPNAPVTTWPLMVNVAGTKKGFGSRRDLCFLGGYKHPPNIDAVFHFIENILPLVRLVQPDIRFIVAGANPTPEILGLASEQVIVTGMVDDLADVFDATRIFVCPLRVGAGAKGKVMSALSYGLPVISTTIGVEGTGLVDGKHVLVADDADSMAQTILRLYEDADLWQALSTAGQSLLREEFSLGMGIRKFEEAVAKGHSHRLGMTPA